MENLQQSAFLTALRSQAQQDEMLKQKIQINSIKHDIKLIVSSLPGHQLINQVLSNLGLSYNIIGLAEFVDKQKFFGLSQLKRILYQLKMIEKQTSRLKNNGNFQNTKIVKTLKHQSHQQAISIVANNNRNSQAKSFQNNKNSLHQNNLQMIKNQIQRELSYRKFINQLKMQNFQEKKKKFLFTKINNARIINKKSEKIYKQLQQKQKQKKQAIMNSLKSENCQDYSIWSKNLYRSASTAKQNFRTHLETQANESPQQNYDIEAKIGICSQRDFSLIKDFVKTRQTQKSKRYIFYQQNSALNISKTESRLQNAITKKRKLDETKLNYAIQKVIKKNAIIQSIHKKKLSTLSDQSGFPQSSMIKKNDQLRNVISDDRQLVIKSKINQSIRKKSQLIDKKSSQVRQRLLKSRDRFLKRKIQINKENDERHRQTIQNAQMVRNALKQKKALNEKNIQRMIRRKREQGQHRQALSEQIMNLKKISDASLQKKLTQLQESRFSSSYYGNLMHA